MLKTPAAPVLVPELRRPSRPAIAITLGAWRYDSGGRSRILVGAAIGVSILVHVIVLFGFNRHTAAKKQVVTDDGIAVNLVMPDLKDLDDPEPLPRDGDEPPVDTGLTVPTLADVPTTVDLSTAFVQQIDYSTLAPKQDLSAAKAIAIPTHINRGNGGAGIGEVFNLSDLDRNPEPIVKVAPQTPASLKHDGFSGQARVGFIVTSTGEVVNAYVISSTTYELEGSALTAISKWKFRPGIKNGRKVNVRMVQPFLFTVTDKDN